VNPVAAFTGSGVASALGGQDGHVLSAAQAGQHLREPPFGAEVCSISMTALTIQICELCRPEGVVIFDSGVMPHRAGPEARVIEVSSGCELCLSRRKAC